MRPGFGNAFLVVLLVLPLSLPGLRQARSQTASPGGRGEPRAEQPQASATVPFDDLIARFISEFYLSEEALNAEDVELLYAEQVVYFDSGLKSRAQILADQQRYYARWSTRRYALLRDTLRVERRQGADKVYDVTFDYRFELTSKDRTSRGRGRTMLTLDLGRDGGRITRETGAVLERW